MKTAVVALAYRMPGASPNDQDGVLRMLSMWASHLRGPGSYQGDVLILTNIERLQIPDVRQLRMNHVCKSIPEVQLAKVLGYEAVPHAKYDSILFLDIDILCVSNLDPLFATDEQLWATHSGIHLLDPRHAGHFVSRPNRMMQKCVPKYWKRMGINTCAFSCKAELWPKYMGMWAQVAERYRTKNAGRSSFPLGDQTVLNYVYYQEQLPISRYPKQWIQHSGWSSDADVKLWHFPTHNRREVMEKKSLLEPASAGKVDS